MRVLRVGLVVVAVGGAVAPGGTAWAEPLGAVVDGNARFSVESPTLIRMEYSGDGRFQDGPTFTAVDRRAGTTPFTTSVEDGERVIRTSALTLRYRENSGPFTASNVRVQLRTGARTITARPRFHGDCAYGIGCDATDLMMSGGAAPASDHAGFDGAGFVAGWTEAGARMGWNLTDIPSAGRHSVRLRYANASGRTRGLQLTAGTTTQRIDLPTTADRDTWAEASTTVTLPAGSAAMNLSCGSGDSCGVDIDSIAVTPDSALYPAPAPSANLGGYRRGLDVQHGRAWLADGIQSRDGWYLLDDTRTALLNPDGSFNPRPNHNGQPYQDGYFFGYGDDHRQALRDFRELTGPAPLLPRSAFGVWFSRYHPYSLADYQNTLLPAFRDNKTPLDQLSVDTQWKSPNPWDGWEFDPALFPDPKALFDWAAAQGLPLALNIHTSITTADSRYEKTADTAGGTLIDATCPTDIACKLFDFHNPEHLRAYFDLHAAIENDYGRPVWWLDQSNESATPDTDVSTDSLMNAAYRAHGDKLGQRGYTLSRIGGNGNDYGLFTPGASRAWADHRSAVHFTGDAAPTWDMLAFEAELTAVEGAGVGVPYVSHDIGGFLPDSPNAHGGKDDSDLYVRWVQFGAFQPILRLHSDNNHAPNGYRLPWDYDPATAAAAEKFLRLRESLVPYTYTLAQQATATGLPIARALYLNYPDHDEAYNHPAEYTYGDDILVAPVTIPGTGPVTTAIWFPPGVWTDYFTGETHTGPGVAPVTTTLDTMPVFLRSGGIVTTRTDYVDRANQSPMNRITVDVATGGEGSFTLYEDAGQGVGYRGGESASTAIGYADATHTLTIDPVRGAYPGAVTDRVWTVVFHDVPTRPAHATVNGVEVPWSHDAATRTLTVTTDARSTAAVTSVGYR